jgi:hypothetical protein
MAEGTKRRPLPALICLLALTLLTALVWWRVLHRGVTSTPTANNPCTSQSTPTLLPQASSVTITVYNATTRTGLAKATAKVLGTDGFKVAAFANDPSGLPVAGVAEIRFSADQKNGASLLSYYLPGAKMVPLSASSDSTLVVALGASFKAVAVPTAAHLAMTSAHVSQAAPGATRTPSPTSTC